MAQHAHVVNRLTARIDTLNGDRYRHAHYWTHEHPQGRQGRRNCMAGIVRTIAYERGRDAVCRDRQNRIDQAVRLVSAAVEIRQRNLALAAHLERRRRRGVPV